MAAASPLLSACLYSLYSSVKNIGVPDGVGGRLSPTFRLPHHLPGGGGGGDTRHRHHPPGDQLARQEEGAVSSSVVDPDPNWILQEL